MIKFQTETTDISRNIGIEMGKKQYGFTDIDQGCKRTFWI